MTDDNDTTDHELDPMIDEIVLKFGILPAAARELVERAAALALFASFVGDDEAAALAASYIVEQIKRGRRAHRFAVEMFGPGGPPAHLVDDGDDAEKEVPDHVASPV